MLKKILFWGIILNQICIIHAGIKRVVNNTDSIYVFTLTDSANKVYKVELQPGAIAEVSFSGHTVKKIEFTPKAPVHKPFTDLYKRAIKDKEVLNENMIYIINHGQMITVYPPATQYDYDLLEEHGNGYEMADTTYYNPELKGIIDGHLSKLKGHTFEKNKETIAIGA